MANRKKWLVPEIEKTLDGVPHELREDGRLYVCGQFVIRLRPIQSFAVRNRAVPNLVARIRRLARDNRARQA